MEIVETEQSTSIARNTISSRENASHHLNVSLLHLMQSRLLLLRQIQAQDSMQGILELKSKLTQLRRQADLFADLIESAIPNDHISKWIGPALEDLRVAAARGTQ
ncbi:MAG: hypothetical protein WBV55_05830 [Candidatus Sulfotelmatobacter sp.]